MLIAYGLVLLAVGMDLKSMRISNRLILIGLGISLVRRFFYEGIPGILTGIFLIFIPVIFLYLLFLAGALGAGDIKLFSVIGGFVNLKELLWCILFSFLFAAIYSLGKLLLTGKLLSSICHVWQYIKSLCMGRFLPYEAVDEEHHYMHFSIAILFGLIVSDLLHS